MSIVLVTVFRKFDSPMISLTKCIQEKSDSRTESALESDPPKWPVLHHLERACIRKISEY